MTIHRRSVSQDSKNFSPCKHVTVGNFCIGNDLPVVFFAGPCVMESRDHAMDMAGALKELSQKHHVGLVYKTSFDKANRTSGQAVRGLRIDQAMAIFDDIKAEFGLPIITDVHSPEQCVDVASHVDILQIPAFLCRQTDLLVAAAKTNKPINVKKGQFLAPWDMQYVAEKISMQGNDQILLCERGASFGYNALVVDFRSLPIMAKTGYPVVFDATHSVQQPGGQGSASGGQREYAPILARAAVAVGVAAIFAETHQDPDRAPSDGPNMIPLREMDHFMESIMVLDTTIKQNLSVSKNVL